MSSKFNDSKEGEGWVYVATHESHKDIVKVGFTIRTPEYRLKELLKESPYPCIGEYQALVSNARLLEKETHKFLDEKREAENKEWFRCTVKEAKDAIKKVAKQNNIKITFSRIDAPQIKNTDELNSTVKKSKKLIKSPDIVEEPPLLPIFRANESVADSPDFLNTVLLAKSSNLPDAQYKLGLMCQLGKGTNRDYKEAVEWYKKAANQGHIDAQINLARMFYDFSWITKNYAEAFNWFTKASEQGSVDAYYYLGKMYQYGHGVKQDLKNSGNFYDKALENGDNEMKRKVIDAYYNLGNMCQHGRGVEIDLDKAENYYIKAIENSNDEMKRKVIRACLNTQK